MDKLVIIGLLLVACVCALAVLYRPYQENFLQFVGLGGLIFGSLSLAIDVASREVAPPYAVCLTIGLVFFTLGTVVKVLKFTQERPSC